MPVMFVLETQLCKHASDHVTKEEASFDSTFTQTNDPCLEDKQMTYPRSGGQDLVSKHCCFRKQHVLPMCMRARSECSTTTRKRRREKESWTKCPGSRAGMKKKNLIILLWCYFWNTGWDMYWYIYSKSFHEIWFPTSPIELVKSLGNYFSAWKWQCQIRVLKSYLN